MSELDVALGRPPAHALVELRGISKTFGATRALDGVDLTVGAGEVVGLVGENGAGKSTLIKVLAGVHRYDSGHLLAGGRQVGPGNSDSSIAFVHQDLGLVQSMSVAENLALQAGYARTASLIGWSRVRRRAQDVLNGLDLDIDPSAPVSDLSSAERSLVAILRAISMRASMLVLDEPTATLSARESRWLLGILARLRDQGVGMLYVSHYLDEVMEISDRIVALRDGRVAMACEAAATDIGAISTAITGRELAAITGRATREDRAPSEPALEVRDYISDRCGPVSFDVRPGEVTVLTGLVGAGQHQITRAVVGAAPCYRGTLRFGARSASARRLAFTSGDRGGESIAPGLSLRENLSVDQRGLRRPRSERHRAAATLSRFGVRPARPELEIDALSGGNQQKVVIARAIESDSEVLVLEDPTNGVDVGAKIDIYGAVAAVVEQRRAVLVTTSDFEEAAAIGDRVFVFRDGQIVRELDRGDIDRHKILSIASGETE